MNGWTAEYGIVVFEETFRPKSEGEQYCFQHPVGMGACEGKQSWNGGKLGRVQARRIDPFRSEGCSGICEGGLARPTHLLPKKIHPLRIG
jgi:hypothetical protein